MQPARRREASTFTQITKNMANADDHKTTHHAELLKIIADAIEAAKVAKKNNKSLAGDNHYAHKFLEFKAAANNSVNRFSKENKNEHQKLLELVDSIFSLTATPAVRAEAFKNLKYSLSTVWNRELPSCQHLEEGGVFPLSVLRETKRGYLQKIGSQANGCYQSGWYDGCAVMMRRLLEMAIIEAFEAYKQEALIRDKNGDYFQLTAIINVVTSGSVFNLSRNTKRSLPDLKTMGHLSAHGKAYNAAKADIDKFQQDFRVAVEEFLKFAGLL